MRLEGQAYPSDVGIHELIAIGTLVAAVVLFITEAIPLAMTALAIPVVLAATGTLESPDQALVGFGNPAVIALGAIFVMGAGLKESGVATLMARGLQRVGGRSEVRLIVAIMASVAVLSAFMSNAATVAVFLPAVAVLARRAEVPASRLMMPLAFAAIVGGALTVIGTTPNLILAEDLRGRLGTPVDMFMFAKVGAPVTAICIAYMSIIGRRMLPKESSEERLGRAQVPEELAEAYNFPENLYRMRVPDESEIAGQSLREADIGGRWSLRVVLVRRPKGTRRRTSIHPHPDLRIEPDDQLYVAGAEENAWRFAEEALVQFGIADPAVTTRLLQQGVLLGEATLPPRSEAIGETFRSLSFRNEFGLSALAIMRRDQVIAGNLGDEPLQLGDAFLVSGSAPDLRKLSEDPRFIVLTDAAQAEDVRRAPLAIALLLVALIPPLVNWLPLALSAIGSALLMLATGCVSLEAARRSVDFRILFLIAGTVPLGMALEQHGVAGEMATFLVQLKSPLGSSGVFAALFVVSAVLSTTSNNGAAAVILAPVAWQVSSMSGLDLSKTFMAVAFGTSCAFMLPFAHQCNLMVMGPGGYRTKDFARVGIGMSLTMAVATVIILELL